LLLVKTGCALQSVVVTDLDASSPPHQFLTPRRRWWLFISAGALGLVLLALTRGGHAVEFNASGPPLPLPPEHSIAPGSLRDLEGVLVGLRGRPVVVNVWASWCGPCRVEAPLLQRAATRYGNAVVFLGVDSKDDLGAGQAFLDRFGISYPNLFDLKGEMRSALGLNGFPTTYVFDRRGRLAAKVFGGISEQTLAARISDARR
jgi:cytochrome c biogenesis protein CcmG/thiol:disulfide interchange protein DsbE